GLTKRLGYLKRAVIDRSPWAQAVGFRLNAEASAIVRMLYEGAAVAARAVKSEGPGSRAPKALDLYRRGGPILVQFDGETYEFTLGTGERAEGEEAAGDGAILSPMPGKIVSVAAKAGARVKKGDALVVLEAMKMEHTLVAPFDGRVAQLNAKPGAQVSEGVL